MAILYLLPNWFFIYSIIFEIIFALASALVAVYSFKVYRASNQKELKLFGAGFTLISISYILWAILNLSVLDRINDQISALSIGQIQFIGSLGVYLHILIFLIGLATIVSSTLKLSDYRAYTLITVLTILAEIISVNKAEAFYLITCVLFIYLVYHYFRKYLKNRKNQQLLLILVAFILLLISHIEFIFTNVSYWYYVLGHFFELAAYITIFVSLLRVIKK